MIRFVDLDSIEEPPADWPTPMDAITPRSLAEIEADVATLEACVTEIERRSASMVEAMQLHYGGWMRRRETAPVDRPAENG